jgi:hypothetical protein
MFCPQCGTNIADGAKFCPNCGAAQTPPAPGQAVVPSAPQINVNWKLLGPAQWVMLGAFVVCGAGTILTWGNGGGGGESLWQLGTGAYAIGDLFSLDSVALDAILVLNLAGLGVLLAIRPATNMKLPNIQLASLILGLLLAAIGFTNHVYLRAYDFDSGIGLYACIAGGLTAAACDYILSTGRLRARTAAPSLVPMPAPTEAPSSR